ncbi:MAG: magnesium transporter CorA [Parasporobacterium sp.]|nr:magnesium transporter CorA [Parasporobacterium sp.]
MEDIRKNEYPYVALVNWSEYEAYKKYFDMGIDMDMYSETGDMTKIQVNYDSLTGCFAIPDRRDIMGSSHIFSFAIDEKGIVFINDDGIALGIIEWIYRNKKWKFPCLERFIYDFLEGIVYEDLHMLLNMGKKLDKLEDIVLDGEVDDILEQLADMRGQILELRSHYGELISVGQELEENENHFFQTANLRYFRLFTERVERFQGIINSLRDQTMQIRDLYHSKLEEKQNKKMALLTAITMIFTPLTFITSWFGMNFKYMHELDTPWGYPLVVGICLAIAAACFIIFKKKKWF